MENKMKVMISLPMNGRQDEEIRNRILYLKKELEKRRRDIEVIDSFLTDEIEDSKYPSVYYLGRTLTNFLHNVDAVYFDDGWIDAKGCRIEYVICMEYDIKILNNEIDLSMVKTNWNMITGEIQSEFI